MSSTPRILRPGADPKTAPIDERAGQILSSLRGIAKKAWMQFRPALRCEARVVAAVDVFLNGERPQHKGLRGAATWDDVLDGGRRMHLFDLLRLGHSPNPRCLAAYDNALDTMAAVRGKVVTSPESGKATDDGHEALARMTLAAAQLQAAAARDLADGKLDENHRAAVEAVVEAARALAPAAFLRGPKASVPEVHDARGTSPEEPR